MSVWLWGGECGEVGVWRWVWGGGCGEVGVGRLVWGVGVGVGGRYECDEVGVVMRSCGCGEVCVGRWL